MLFFILMILFGCGGLTLMAIGYPLYGLAALVITLFMVYDHNRTKEKR